MGRPLRSCGGGARAAPAEGEGEERERRGEEPRRGARASAVQVSATRRSVARVRPWGPMSAAHWSAPLSVQM